jgi:hypothetical protein
MSAIGGRSLGACGKLGKLGTSQDFLLSVTFRASGGGASLKPAGRASHTPVVCPLNNTAGKGGNWPRPGLLFFGRVMAMTVRIIPILVVAIMIGPSLAYGSPACMTESEARAKFSKAHLIWLGTNHCWTFGVAPVHSRRPVLAAETVPSPRPEPAAEPVPSPRPVLAAEPVPSPRPEIVNSDIDAGAQCRYSPCE